ncbi:MAG: hypothetical protein K0R84_1777 [Clostridia bacterium]|nr:hypothetical protein [Clostridia bacterium]
MRYISSKRVIIILFIFLLILIALFIRNYTVNLIGRMNNYLPNNLYINDIHIGNKTLAEAEELIKILEAVKLDKEIVITYEDGKGYVENHSFTYGELGYFAEKKVLMDELTSIFDNKGNIFKRIWQYKSIERSARNYTLKFNIDYNRFAKALNVFDSSKLQKPINAKYAVVKGKIVIVKEEIGYMFDKQALYNKLVADTSLNAAKLQVKAVNPSITAAQLAKQGIKEKISEFTTRFDAGNASRSSNIRLAAKIINGTVLAPGEVFSFNTIVGERTLERGFKEAGVYMNGKVDTGIGGGICQVSTTLYNAVLYADLHVLERYNHSLTVPYVPLSRDAAVSWGLQDFRFVNNTDYHIYIYASASKSSITFALFSTKSNKTVDLISTTISKIKAPVLYKDDASLEVGKQLVEDSGHDGFESQLVKKVYVNSKLVNTGIVSKDKYGTTSKIVIRGTKLSEPEPPPPYYFPIYE